TERDVVLPEPPLQPSGDELNRPIPSRGFDPVWRQAHFIANFVAIRPTILLPGHDYFVYVEANQEGHRRGHQ
ncbi:MAG: hypothetical protein LC642_02260, partial [Verrucomicrobiaceae bacterium]|nr:hypothetical protein [Verrucomicrobiaceae bacterium]